MFFVKISFKIKTIDKYCDISNSRMLIASPPIIDEFGASKNANDLAKEIKQ